MKSGGKGELKNDLTGMCDLNKPEMDQQMVKSNMGSWNRRAFGKLVEGSGYSGNRYGVEMLYA